MGPGVVSWDWNELQRVFYVNLHQAALGCLCAEVIRCNRLLSSRVSVDFLSIYAIPNHDKNIDDLSFEIVCNIYGATDLPDIDK